MSSTAQRLAALAAVAAMGVPVASASAASPPLPLAGLPPSAGLPVAGLPAFDPAALPAFDPAGLAFVGPAVGQVAAVIGPTVITTAPSNFVNTNLQTTAGGALSGGQAGP